MAKPRVMQPKPEREPLKVTDIFVGKTYRGKHPRKAGFSQRVNDRTVIWLSPMRSKVQYDSSSVKDGAEFPMVTMEQFLKWASHEVF